MIPLNRSRPNYFFTLKGIDQIGFTGGMEEQTTPQGRAYMAALDALSADCPEIAGAILGELGAQRSTLKMIASENYCSLNVQLAMGNLLTDKYAEGYSHHRFYAGCEHIDTVEDLAVAELKKLFGCDHAYVQPHSGIDANLVAFWSIIVQRVQNREIERFDRKSVFDLSDDEYERIRLEMVNQRLLGMSLNSGGHLTHGFRHNVSSKMMQAHTYDVDPETHLLDYDVIWQKAKEVKPLILLAGYSAYPRLIDFAKMRQIADDVGATLMCDMAHFAGLVAGKAITGDHNPIPFAQVVTSTTHKTLRGPRGGIVMCTNEFADIVDKGCPTVLGGPLPHVMAAKAVAFKEANTPDFQNYAAQIVRNSKALAERLKKQGVHLTTGGTDNHLLVIDVMKSFGITGLQAEHALTMGGITVNRNAIPFDPNGAWYTSGVRLGTPALTTRGMKEDAMHKIADCIIELLKSAKPTMVKKTGKPSRAKVALEESALAKVQGEVDDLLKSYPLYPELHLKETHYDRREKTTVVSS